MTHPPETTLRRVVARREATAIFDAFAPLLEGVDAALVGIDARVLVGLGEWESVPLADAFQSTDAALRAGVQVFPLPATGEPIGALVARGSALSDPHPAGALHALHRALDLFVGQAIEKRAIAQETLDRYREINLLYDIGETITSCLDVQILYQRVMEESCRIIQNDAEAVFVVDDERDALAVQAAENLTAGTPTACLAQDAARRAIADGHALIENDLPPAEGAAWVHALLSVPLKTRDRVLGAIVLLRGEEKGMFTAGEEKLLNALAMQTAIALENARLYALVGDALQRREGQLSTVEEIARELNATLNLDRVLGLVTTRSMEAAGAHRGAIVLQEEEGKRQIVSSYGFTGDLTPRLQALVRQVIETQRAAAAGGEHLVVPILLGDRPLGAIVLADSARGFGAEAEAFVSHLTAQAATAIHNARLYQNAEQERSKLAAILTSTREALIVTDSQQSVLLFNPAAQIFFGAPLEAVAGRPLKSASSAASLIALVERSKNEQKSLVGEVTGPEGGTFYAGVSPVSGIGWVVVMQDITYLKELDSLRSEFVATASHDLKNPIGVIMGYASMMPHLGPLSDSQKESLDQIMNAAQNMANLINNLLDIIRIEAGFLGQVQICDMGSIVKDVVGQLRHQATGKKIKLREHISKKLALVLGNPHRLSQVVTNLVGNAIKYTPEGGHIKVTVEPQNGAVVVAVEDTGLGIAAEDLAHMFERFYRAREVSEKGIEGTGLGLSICKSIVEKHDGSIWVTSKKGHGSTFTFSLPAAE